MTFKTVWSVVWHPQSSFNKAFKADETFKCLEGRKQYTWRAVRRQNIDKLFLDIAHITICLVVASAFGPERIGMTPTEKIGEQAALKHSEYGVVYQLCAFGWWGSQLILSIVVGILWFPILKWIDPSSYRTISRTTTGENGVSHTIIEETPGGFMHYVELLNYYVYTIGAYIYVCQFSFHLYETIVHVKAKPKKGSSTTTASLSPIDVRKTWYTRLSLITGMVLGVALGAAVMLFWYRLELVHVTRHEYALIIIPVQITLGIAAASIFQAMSEKEMPVPKKRELAREAVYKDLTIEDMT